jgi:cell division protein FtsW (lipid II flippase)
MNDRRSRLSDLLSLCAPIPALILGVLTMRELDVPTSAWSLNLAAGVMGLLLFVVMRVSAWPVSRRAWSFMTIVGITAILATFASAGMDGVHRWVFLGGFGLHASAVVAPVLIACVATAPSRLLMIITAAATTLILALQPDAAQACSFAAACGVILFCNLKFAPRQLAGGLVVLLACAILSFVRPDPLKPVRHVEGIFEVVSARGAGWALLATVVLLLLPLPYFVAWTQRRQCLTLALGVYVVMVTIAPAWGTFPVPVMGYGVSPILGYFIALALSARSTSPLSA